MVNFTADAYVYSRTSNVSEKKLTFVLVVLTLGKIAHCACL